MTDFIIYLLLSSLIIFGGRFILFELLPSKLVEWNEVWPRLTKPLYACPPCMASVWGVPLFFGFGLPLLTLPLFLVCLVGLNHIINEISN